MATRIQVRRGTTSQWNTANPTLEEGEIGYNSTLGQIKVGDGTSVWADLDYFISDTSLGTSLGTYVQDSDKSAVNGVAELDASKNILAPSSIIFEGTANDFETTLAVTDPTADRTITFPDATGTVALTTDISVTAASTTTFSNKSISLGSNTVTSTLAQLNTAISDADVASLAGTETLTNKTLTSPVINTPTGITKTDVGLANVNNTTDANKPISSATQTALDLKAPLAAPAFTGTATAVNLTISGDLTVNGTTTNLNSTNLVIEDKNIILGDTATPTDVTADGGGITLKGTTDKTFNWVDATDAWTSSENMNLLTGKVYEINGTTVLSGSTLGSGVTGSSLTSVGTITSGTWTGTTIAIANGGTGATTAMTAATALLPTQTSNSGKYLTTDGSGTLSWGTVSGYSAPTLGSTSISSGATVSNIAGLTINSTTIPTSATLLTSGGALGTPSSGTLTNATGLPISGLTSSTSTALGLGTIELGHATDTTISRVSAGIVAIEGVNIVTTSSTDTLTNKTLSSVIATTAFTLNATGELRLADSDSSNYVGFKSPATVATNRVWTLPSADGTSGQTLSTNGSGTLSFSTPAAGAAFSEFMLIGC
jgi:hypothetical protein